MTAFTVYCVGMLGEALTTEPDADDSEEAGVHE
jgi:hypothetical protein